VYKGDFWLGRTKQASFLFYMTHFLHNMYNYVISLVQKSHFLKTLLYMVSKYKFFIVVCTIAHTLFGMVFMAPMYCLFHWIQIGYALKGTQKQMFLKQLQTQLQTKEPLEAIKGILQDQAVEDPIKEALKVLLTPDEWRQINLELTLKVEPDTQLQMADKVTRLQTHAELSQADVDFDIQMFHLTLAYLAALVLMILLGYKLWFWYRRRSE
jgi:hypothetical protein